MPVTIMPGHHEPKLHPTSDPPKSWKEFLQISCPTFCNAKTQILASSVNIKSSPESGIYPSSAGLVRSILEAWGCHSHLVIRPDDVWFTILVQLNFYMKKNAESLRDLFVSHSGKKRLVTRCYSYADAIQHLCDQLQSNVRTPSLWDWIRPQFSTSTFDDEVTAGVLMMGAMQAYFEYEKDVCGIPSVTLMGCKEDWELLLAKLDTLKEFGSEPEDYAKRLRPLMMRMAASFDNPSTDDTREFWDQMVHARLKHYTICGDPEKQYIVSGWIVGLFYWDAQGDINRVFAWGRSRSHTEVCLEYDGIRYGDASLTELPVGYASVPLDDRRGEIVTECWIIAGGIGKQIVHGAPQDYHSIAPSNDHEVASQDHNAVPEPEPSWADDVLSCLDSLDFSNNHERKDSAHKDPKIKSVVMKSSLPDGHSTIQPMSGWFVVTPRYEDPCAGIYDGEELSGPTVDAINSCTSVDV